MDASTAKFEMVTVLNLPMLFTCCRVDQDTVPDDLYIYEVSHEEDVLGTVTEEQLPQWAKLGLERYRYELKTKYNVGKER